jgi:hypothetical protein
LPDLILQLVKKVLFIYYSQTGQLKRIVESVAKPFQDHCKVCFEEIRPLPAYPFPWNGMPFFQVFPESVKEIPCPLEPLKNDPEMDYDLVILAYQVWYLSPSIPVTSFLKSEQAGKLLKGKPVVTLLGVRNMWIMAQERMKAMIRDAGGIPAGNIVLDDPAANLTSVITIVRWMMKGEKGAFKWMGKKFPPAGVPEEKIKNAGIFGKIILNSLQERNYSGLQDELIAAGAVSLDPVLYNIEKRGKMMFGVWANLILKKGAYNDPRRENRLKAFKYYLFTVIYLISPFVSGLFRIIFFLNPRAARKFKDKFSKIN